MLRNSHLYSHPKTSTLLRGVNGPLKAKTRVRIALEATTVARCAPNDSAFSRAGPQTLALSCDSLPGVGWNAQLGGDVHEPYTERPTQCR